jgi:putative flippase GtrA
MGVPQDRRTVTTMDVLESRRKDDADYQKLLRFACVGVFGFLVDASVLTLLSTRWGINLYAARVISFAAASLATWLLNRRFTFSLVEGQSKRVEYVRYMVVQSVGSLTNLGVFMVLVGTFSWLARVPVIPLAVGAAAGLLVNFAGSKTWVFR